MSKETQNDFPAGRPTREDHPSKWLEIHFRERRAKNGQYSMRSFARFLQLSPGRLSELFAQKRLMTLKLANKIADRLEMDGETRREFLSSVVRSRTQEPDKRNSLAPAEVVHQLESDVFEVIADWQHFAILNLMKTSNFSPIPRVIAQRLGISVIEVQGALLRLSRLGLIKKESGTLVRTYRKLRTTSEIPSSALRKSHRQTLEQAIAALDEVPVDERSVSSVTLALNPSTIPIAKKMIARFHQELSETLEATPRPTEVYNVNIQLVPLTKRARKKS